MELNRELRHEAKYPRESKAHTHTYTYVYIHTHICECIYTYVNKSHIGAEKKNLAWTIGILMDKREKKTGFIVPIINEIKFQIDKRFKC